MASEALTAAARATIARGGGPPAARTGGHRPTLPPSTPQLRRLCSRRGLLGNSTASGTSLLPASWPVTCAQSTTQRDDDPRTHRGPLAHTGSATPCHYAGLCPARAAVERQRGEGAHFARHRCERSRRRHHGPVLNHPDCPRARATLFNRRERQRSKRRNRVPEPASQVLTALWRHYLAGALLRTTAASCNVGDTKLEQYWSQRSEQSRPGARTVSTASLSDIQQDVHLACLMSPHPPCRLHAAPWP